jgi:hypothetical protein
MVEGASASRLAQAPHAPSTMLRMVARSVSLRGGECCRHCDAGAPDIEVNDQISEAIKAATEKAREKI